MHKEGRGVKQDLAKAFELTKAAAEAGIPQAQLNLALLYESGEGAPRDLKLALEWATKAERAVNPVVRDRAAAVVGRLRGM
jgi:TPR repeat protein